MYKICFIAPSGYGKSTAVSILRKFFNLENIKIAEPLYYLQNYFYDFINTQINGEQDGELLQFLGIKIRKENKKFLLNQFKTKLSKLATIDIITNDDCRPPDYDVLKELGFIFIGINGFNRDRYDHSKADPKSVVEWQDKPKCEYWVDNLGSMKEYENNLLILMNNIFGDKGHCVCKKS
jgi:hypothetical protein